MEFSQAVHHPANPDRQKITPRTVEEIRAELDQALFRESEAKKAERAAVKVVMAYTITPATSEARWEEVYDDTISLYKITGVCTNRDEAKAVGHSPSEGGMVYAFNQGTGKIIMGVGGGTYFISRGWGSQTDRDPIEAFEEINAFLADHPEGGDITDIVERFRTKSV